MKELEKKDIDHAIATIRHNIECVEEAIKEADEKLLPDLFKERKRLQRLLNFYERKEEEYDKTRKV